MARTPLSAPLTALERVGLVALVVVAVAFGVLVEVRSAFCRHRMTDLDVYLRAGWAVRQGEDPYDFTTANSCHYQYPPLFAILFTPLAEPPAGVSGVGTLPFGVTVAIWYIFSLVATAWAVHILASALERRCPDPAVRRQAPGCRRWWALRVLPALVCLPGITRTLALGQVDLLILMLLCATGAAVLNGRPGRGGLWHAAAISIKVIPLFLVLIPLWRRDGRWLLGCAVGLAITLVLIPVAVFGPTRAWEYHRKWAEVVMLPSLGGGSDRSREADLTSMTAVNSQSLVAIFHNYQYPDKATRAAVAAPSTRWAAWLVGGLLTLAALAAAGLHRPLAAPQTLALFGSSVVVMLLIAPICHPHYFCHWLPLVMALLAWDLERHGNLGFGTGIPLLLLATCLANALTSVPGCERLRDGGLATAAGLALWAGGAVVVWRPAVRLRRNQTPEAVRLPAAA